MKNLRLFLLISILLWSSCLFGQDIVYDTLRGNPSSWMKIKGGSEQIHIRTSYENLGYLSKSKVVVGAGILDGLQVGVDYQDYTFDYDTLIYEFSTDTQINMILYRYYYDDVLFRNFVGLRKADLGADVFDGKYMFICPIVYENSIVNIYNGIGDKRRFYQSIKLSDINESSYGNWMLWNEVTLETINISKILRQSKTDDFISVVVDNPYDDIKVWPNPVSGPLLNIEFPENNSRKTIRVYSLIVTLMLETFMDSDKLELDISQLKSGIYFVLISDEKGIVLSNTKLVILH